jgi:hypothetical protein
MSVASKPEPRVRSFEPAARFRMLMKIGNAVMVPLLRSRIGRRMHDLALLDVTGRTSGRRYAIPVGYHRLYGDGIVLTASPWRRNLRDGGDVRVTHEGTTRTMRAELIEDPREVADVYGALLERVGVRHSTRVGLRVAGDEMPTQDELVDAIGGRRAVVRLTAK